MTIDRFFEGIAQAYLRFLPAVYRRGKGPYIVFFVGFAALMLLVYSATTAYSDLAPLFVLMATCWLVLLVLFNYGMSLSVGVHLGTLAGLSLLAVAVWQTGGIFSPLLSWSLVLPLTPFYVISRRAGAFWMLLVGLGQSAMAMANHWGWVPTFQPGLQNATASGTTFALATGVLFTLPLIYDRLHVSVMKKKLRYQRELELKRQELEVTLQMREHFIAKVSHELRTPMNAILGFNALLLSTVEDKPEAIKVLNHTRQSADHLMTVINDVLDYSQLQSGHLAMQFEVFELRQTLQHAFDLFGPRVSSMNIAYRIELDPSLPVWVNSDRHRLMQVLVNLLGNALKFTHDGSVVLSAQVQGNGILFAVQDTGIGISPDRQTEIFNRFSQAHEDIQSLYGGNGLGLSISRQLVNLLGGDIGLQSTPGIGSRFWFLLPLQAEALPEQAADPMAKVLRSQDRAWQFLVVDDHPINRLLVKQVMQGAWPHCTVLEALNGQQALDLLHQHPVDLVLMDMVMPVMDGIDTTQAIRSDPDAKIRQVMVMGLTANVNPLDLARFKVAGLSDVLPKPFEPDELCLKIEQLLLVSADSP